MAKLHCPSIYRSQISCHTDMEFVFKRVENIAGKRENAGYY